MFKKNIVCIYLCRIKKFQFQFQRCQGQHIQTYDIFDTNNFINDSLEYSSTCENYIGTKEFVNLAFYGILVHTLNQHAAKNLVATLLNRCMAIGLKLIYHARMHAKQIHLQYFNGNCGNGKMVNIVTGSSED